MGTVPLPAASITIVSPAQAVSSTRGLFPHLRIRVVPEVTLPASLAPPNAKGRGLEDSLKVIVRVGSKVHVSWKVEAGALPVGQRQDPEALLCKVQIAVGEWLTLNQDNLAVDRFDYPETGVDNGGSLIFTPISALPPHSLLDRNLIPTGEPVTELTAVHLSLRWSFADNRGRKRRVNVEELFSFEALFGDPDTPQESQSVPEDPKPGQDIDMEAEALAQVGLGMQKVMRLQLIRRFPLVFDSEFIQFGEAVAIPQGLMDGANRFITVSARFGTPLAPRCRELFDALQDSRARHLAFQANAMATLPVATRAPKRPKAEMQDDSAPAAAESQDVDDAELDRITAYLTSLRLEEESKAVEDKFCNAVAQGIAAIGTARWLQVRLDGRTKMSAYRAFLREPEHFHAVLPASDSTDEPLWDAPDCSESLDSSSPLTPRHALPRAPLDGHQELAADELDDIDAEDCYEDDTDEVESPDSTYIPLAELLPPVPQHRLVPPENALHLHLGAPSWSAIQPDEHGKRRSFFLVEHSVSHYEHSQPHFLPGDGPAFRHLELQSENDLNDLDHDLDEHILLTPPQDFVSPSSFRYESYLNSEDGSLDSATRAFSSLPMPNARYSSHHDDLDDLDKNDTDAVVQDDDSLLHQSCSPLVTSGSWYMFPPNTFPPSPPLLEDNDLDNLEEPSDCLDFHSDLYPMAERAAAFEAHSDPFDLDDQDITEGANVMQDDAAFENDLEDSVPHEAYNNHAPDSLPPLSLHFSGLSSTFDYKRSKAAQRDQLSIHLHHPTTTTTPSTMI